MSTVFMTTVEDLLEFHRPEFSRGNQQFISRAILLKCAAVMSAEKKMPMIRFRHEIYPRTSGKDANGKEYGVEVWVVDSSKISVPACFISAGPQDIGVNSCVSLSTQGIQFFKKKLS